MFLEARSPNSDLLIQVPCKTDSLEIRCIPSKGRGVFALRSFAQGELIERVPVIIISSQEWKLMERTVLYHYTLAWGEKDNVAIMLGYGSLYNHSYQPSAYYSKNYTQETVDFIALRPIFSGEEILVNYNGPSNGQEPLWFEVRT